MQKKWVLKTPDSKAISDLKKHLHISDLLATLLVNRDITDFKEASLFLSGTLKDLPSPFLMKDMEKACKRILKAIDKNESIFIYGDYDVDGVTATSNLLNFFKEIGVRAQYHIPHRLKEGYGLHVGALKEIKEKGGDLVITADCGISNVKEAIAASALGVDLIITDHHIIPPELPDAHAVLNPLRPGSEFPDLYLAGVGVAFFLMVGLRSMLRERGFFKNHEPHLGSYLDLVALGTIADMVPLRGANHILVKEGLKILSKKQRVGVRALCDVSGISNTEIGPYEVGFQLAPRLNAGGRISSATFGVELLTTDDSLKALEVAQKLNSENNQRRFLQTQTLEQAVAKIEKEKLYQKKSLVLSSAHWHPGVIGIVASKLVEKYHLPTCLISEQEEVGKGSGRSISALNLHEALQKCKSHFLNFGGHKAAAGFSIEKGKIEAFQNAFNEVVQSMLSPEDWIQKIQVDMKLSLGQVNEALLQELSFLHPFGMGNREPLFWVEDFKVTHSKVVGEKHLKLLVQNDEARFDAIGFYLSEHHPDAHKFRSLLFQPMRNTWQGKSSIQLKLKDISL